MLQPAALGKARRCKPLPVSHSAVTHIATGIIPGDNGDIADAPTAIMENGDWS